MVGGAEAARRVASRLTGRLYSLPVLALTVHTACNCRCVMCDIWRANAQNRQITPAEIAAQLDAIRRLRVQRVMLTGGEPLLHSNLWLLCRQLRDQRIRITLVTTGLLVARHVHEIAELVDELVVSVDGPPAVHDQIRRVRGGFERVARGIGLLAHHAVRPRTVARSVVQRANHARLTQTVESVAEIGIDRLSFLAADVTSTAFNRPEPWDSTRQAEITLADDHRLALAAAIGDVESRCARHLESGFIVGGLPSLWRIYDYYEALAGAREFPRVRCNAPWVSAVMEPGGSLRPCFFHPAYEANGTRLDEAINAPQAIAFRRSLDPRTDDTCKRCVCSLFVSPSRQV